MRTGTATGDRHVEVAVTVVLHFYLRNYFENVSGFLCYRMTSYLYTKLRFVFDKS